MLTRESKRKLTGVAVCLAPPMVVLGAVFLFQPQVTVADDQALHVETPHVAVATATTLTGRALRVAERAEQLRNAPFGESPLYYPPRTTPVNTPVVDKTPQVRGFTAAVQMIMASARGNTALVDNKPYRVGDVLPGTQWELTGINADQFSVTFTHQVDGRIVQRAVPLPGNQPDFN